MLMESDFYKMKKKLLKTQIKKFGIIFTLFCLALTVCMLSQLDFLTSRGIPYTDSSVFQYMGRIIDAGYIPYKDSFDHKGLLLYFINFIGVKIAYHRGIWLIELIFMITTVIGIYKMSRLFCGRFQSIMVVMLVLSPMTIYFQGGNLTEEYALPMQIWSLYIYVDYILNDRKSKERVILCGMLFASVLFIRANMIPVWVVFSLYIFINKLKSREFKELIALVKNFFIGACIISLPLIVYIIKNGALDAFIYDYLIFNKAYSSVALMQKVRAFLYFFNNPIILIAFTILVFKFIKAKSNEKRIFYIVYFIYMLMAISLISMSGETYGHYGMVLLPMLIYPYSLLFNVNKEAVIMLSSKVIIIIYIIISFIVPNWINMIINFTEDLTNYNNSQIEWGYLEYDNMINYIKNNTRDSDLITVYGNENAIYNLSNRFSASVYSFQPEYDPKIIDEYFLDLEKNEPKLIILTGDPTQRMNEFLIIHNYKNVEIFDKYIIYQKEN